MNARLTAPLLLALVAACASNPPEAAPPPAPAPAAAEEVPAVPSPPAAPVGGAKEAVEAAGLTPQALYERCRSRVEGRESAGECETDADCMATGCSGEVCLTKEMAQGLATTCEMLPCFEVLDTCGCVEGVCSWSLKDSVPAGKTIPVPLPEKQ